MSSTNKTLPLQLSKTHDTVKTYTIRGHVISLLSYKLWLNVTTVWTFMLYVT